MLEKEKKGVLIWFPNKSSSTQRQREETGTETETEKRSEKEFGSISTNHNQNEKKRKSKILCPSHRPSRGNVAPRSLFRTIFMLFDQQHTVVPM